MNGTSYRLLLLCLWLLGTLAPAQTFYDEFGNSMGNGQFLNQGMVVPNQAQLLGQPSKSTETLKLLFEGKSSEAAQFAIDHLTSLVPAYLASDPKEQRPYHTEFGFIQFIQAYQLGPIILSQLLDSTDALQRAALTEMVGKEEQALTLYKNAPDDVRMRQRYAFLLAKHGRVAEAKEVLAGVDPANFSNVLQSLQSMITSQQLFIKRLDYMDLLITALENADPATYLAAEWLPNLINNSFAQQHYSNDERDVRLVEMYANGDYRTGYNSPEQEERSQVAAERRLLMHDALCKAMMRLPQFADEGFRRFSGMASKQGGESDLSELAITMLNMPPAPKPPEGTTVMVQQEHFFSHWVPFHRPIEFLLRKATQEEALDQLITSLTPILNATGKGDELPFLHEFKATLESPIDGFPDKVAALMQMKQDSMSTNNLVRLLMDVMKSREIEDMGPLIEAYFVRIGDTPYPSLQEVVDYGRAQRKLGLEQFQTFIKKIGTILLGPADQQAAFIAEHYQPNQYQSNTPNMRVINYVSFLNQLGQQLELTAPVLAEVYALSLIHPNDYRVRSMVENTLQSWRYQNQSAALPKFIKDSPFLNDLADFQPYPLQNVQRNSVFGHFLDSLRSLGSSDRTRYLQTVHNHKPDTFGKQVILAYVEGGSSSSKRSLALTQVLELQMEAIGKLPMERQLALYEWFRQMHSSRSSLSSSIRTACPKTATWYASMKQEASKQPSVVSSQQRRRSNANNSLPSIETFLAADNRQAVEIQQPLQFMATQLAQSVLSSDLKQAEAIFARYLELAIQEPSANFNPGNNTSPKPQIDLILSQLLQGSPGTENLGFVIKMIHLAKDPNEGVYPNLQNSMAQALANESFEPVTTLDNDMAKTFLAASGGQVHELLVPLLLMRFQSVETETLQRIRNWAKEHPNNAFSSMLLDTADLAVSYASNGKRPLSKPGLIQRLTNATTPLALRMQACPSTFHMALQAQAWPVAEACLSVVSEALADEEFVVSPMFTEQMIVAPAKRAVTSDERRILKQLLELWTTHGERLPMSIAALQRATALAARADYPPTALVAKLPASLQRQPGFVTSMLRMGADDAALNAVPWSLVMMPPQAQMQNNRSNSRSTGLMRRTGEQLNAPMNLGQGHYDAALHAKSAAFLPTISDAGQRLFVEFTIAALLDAADLPDTIPNRAERLQSLAERYDRNVFSSSYLAEHTVSWLCTASGSIPKPLRDEVDHFGRQMDYQPLSKWNDQAQRASRMNLWNHFLKNASTNAPEVFATVINDMLGEIGTDRGQTQQLLEVYVGDFPKDLLKDVASITPEKAAGYLPLLKTLAKRARSTYWSGRDSCINGNIVMHILANQGQAYGEWKEELDSNTQNYLDGRMNVDEIIYMMRKTLSKDEVSKERRSELLNGLFATTAPSSNNNNRSSNSQDTNVFERMIDLDVLTAQDILDNGSEWAEENPRGGAAFGELAKYQADAGQVDQAIVNYTQAVVHTPSENQRLYTQYHLANANLLLKQDRVEAAMTWFDFAQSGRIYSSYKEQHEALKRQVQVRFLTDPARMTATFTRASQQLASNPNDVAAWVDLSKTLSAFGGHRMSQSDYMRGLSVLKLTYYLLQKVQPLDPSAVDELLPAVTNDLSKGLIALGLGGRKNYLVPRGQRWSYHYPEEGLSNSSWKSNRMRLEGWNQAVAPIGYGNGNEATIIPYGDDEDNKPITAYFNKQVTIQGLNEGDQLTLGVLHDDGVIVYIDGNEVARNNMPSGPVSPTTQTPNSRGGTDEKEYWTTTIPSTVFKSGNTSHIIAAEVHQNDSESSDLSFDLELYTEAFNQAAIIKEVETGNPLKQLAKWKDHLPENLIEMAKSLSQP